MSLLFTIFKYGVELIFMAIIIASIISCTYLAIVARNGLAPYNKSDADIKQARDDLGWVIGIVIGSGVLVIILIVLIIGAAIAALFAGTPAELTAADVVAAGKTGLAGRLEKLVEAFTILVIIILVVFTTILSIICFHAIAKIRASNTYKTKFSAIKKYYYDAIGAAITGLIPAAVLLVYFIVMIIIKIYERNKVKETQNEQKEEKQISAEANRDQVAEYNETHPRN